MTGFGDCRLKVLHWPKRHTIRVGACPGRRNLLVGRTFAMQPLSTAANARGTITWARPAPRSGGDVSAALCGRLGTRRACLRRRYEADVDRTYVSALERSEYAATIDMVDKLARALGVEAGALLRRPTRSRQRGRGLLD